MMYDILAIAGIVWVISYSKALKPIREWATKKATIIGVFLNCWGCMGLWVSFIYIWLPYREYIRFVFAAVICLVVMQIIIDKLK